MAVACRKIVFILSTTAKKYIMAVPFVILATIFISAIIFANTAKDPLAGKNIVIDPGHGGIDPGTNDGGIFLEKDINLQISLKLKDILESRNSNVELTRSSDISLDNQNNLSSSRHKRDLLARITRFNSGKYDLFISIHVNRSSNNRAIGPLVLYSSNFPSSGILAASIQESLNKHIKTELKVDTKRKPVRSSDFILKYANIPGVIVEAGFISNPHEKKLLLNESYQAKLVQSICKGIENYFKNINELNEPGKKDNAPQPAPPAEDESVPTNVMYAGQPVDN